MPRPLRLEYKDAVYHVSNQGRDNQVVFQDDRYYAAFMETLAEAYQRFGLQVLAYSVTRGQYDLLVKTPRGNLSRAMRHVNGLYTQRYNKLKGTDGPLFKGRYKSVLVDADDFLLEVTRYIHLVPVLLKKSSLKKVAEYAWSSFPAYINAEKAPIWLEREGTYDQLGEKKKYQAYREYVEEGLDEGIAQFYDKKRISPILGGQEFYDRIRAQLKAGADAKPVVAPSKDLPSIKAVIDAVAAHFKTDNKGIKKSSRGRGQKNIPRWYALYLCREVGGHELSAIAKAFGMEHISGINHAVNRLKELVDEDKKASTALNKLVKQLSPAK